MAVGFGMMSGKSNPRAAQLVKKNFRKEKAECHNCEANGIWWHIDDHVICHGCLNLTVDQQRAIEDVEGKLALYSKLTEMTNNVFEVHMETAVETKKVNKQAIDQMRDELKARSGKLYLFENSYVNASRKAKKLIEQAQEAERDMKRAKNAFEVERIEIAALESKLIDMKIRA